MIVLSINGKLKYLNASPRLEIIIIPIKTMILSKNNDGFVMMTVSHMQIAARVAKVYVTIMVLRVTWPCELNRKEDSTPQIPKT